MHKKAQILVIGLWILIILSILAIGIAHRVSLALRVSRYHREKLKAIYLAKAAINLAITELKNDDRNYDCLQDKWVDDEEKFAKIYLTERQNEFATVGYTVKDEEEEEEKVIFGIIDEERKININTASLQLLTEMLGMKDIFNADKIANNICAWRGDTGVEIPDYEDSGYVNKAAKFANPEELMLIKDVNEDAYNAIKDLITVYSEEGKVNINTATSEVLKILINGSFKALQKKGVAVENPEGLLESIISFREAGGVFEDINLDFVLTELSNLQKNIINEPVDGLKNKITVKSRNFRIVAFGNIQNLKLKSRIECVFDREQNKINYWHQN